MLGAPIAVACARAFVEFGVLIAEDKTNVDVGVLFPDEQVFLPVINCPTPLRFDIKKAARFWQLEVGRIGSLSLGPDVFYFVCFVFYVQTSIFNLCRYPIFQA